MFEVMVTLRPDFREVLLDRYPTEEESQDRARALTLKHFDRVVRAWVRRAAPAAAERTDRPDDRSL